MRCAPLLAAALSLRSAAAWGDVGHRTIGLLAEKYFTPAASDLVSSLLGNLDDNTVSDAATWADGIKRSPGFTQTRTWHYIDAHDNPPQQCGLKYPSDCGSSGCVVSAIVNQTALLLDTAQDAETRSNALKFVFHFIGDVHQPLHVENLLVGGNGIKACFGQRCSGENLHAIWDTDIIHKYLGLHHSEKHNAEVGAARDWAQTLFDAGGSRPEAECADVAGDPQTCVLQWAAEANGLVCSYVLKPGVEWLESHDLSAEYYDGAAPIVVAQVTRAGLRLAAWVNAVAAQLSSQRVEL